jgi:hypothetical protein
MKRVHGSFLMVHEHVARALVELRHIRKTSSGADRVLHDPPEAFDGVEVVPTMRGEEMEAQRAVVVVEGRVEPVRPMDAAAIHDPHDIFASFAEGGHHLMEILA